MTGDAPDPVAAGGGDASEPGGDEPAPIEKPKATRSSRTEIELEVSRSRSIGWAIFGLVLGGLLVWQLGTVGVWAGELLVLTGIYHLARLVQTLIYPAGSIIVSDREVSLPRGLCRPRPLVVEPKAITAAYFLRRSVPWNRASPVLVVELGAKALLFPRDWFASESDQRHIIHALLRGRPAATAADAKPGAEKDADAK